EENPWDVFETIFTIGSVHEGTITNKIEKGVLVALQYGVEGFAGQKHILKEDGSVAKIEEKLDFKVIEFSKSAKRIILSHTKIWEEDSKAPANEVKQDAQKAKKMKINLEKTTLGDVTDLQALKDKLEENKKD
ncbi:MAG: S1 RNA-binding domain-containing protein, partial [Bacteroidales bacterium]|nr:S1 RNA-binding domain-containing protein [Bacteroidales bacterium]